MIGTKITFHYEGYTRIGKVLDKVRVPQVSQQLQMIVVPDCYLVDMESKKTETAIESTLLIAKPKFFDGRVVCVSPEKILTIET